MNAIVSAVNQWLEQKYNWEVNHSDMYALCRDCAKFKTDACPNSIECLDTLDKPHYERKM